MSTRRSDPALLNDPVAAELLASDIPARLAYVATDGMPSALTRNSM